MGCLKLNNDYYPFDNYHDGMQIQERSYSATTKGYRFGFNGYEKVDEIAGQGNAIDFGARLYDSRLGRWMSVDPLFDDPKNVSYSPYNFAVNSPIAVVDEDGEIWWIAVGAVIGGGATAIKLAIDGELNFKDGAWKKTVAKIGLGAATGAAIATFPASGLAAGGGLLTSTAIVSSVGAGATAFTSNVIDQGIDKHFDGEDVLDLKSYDYKKAGVNGVITAVSFGAGSVIGNKLATGGRKYLWSSFNKQAQLFGVGTASAIDVTRAVIEGLIDKFTEYEDIQLPEVTVGVDKETGDTEVDADSLDEAIRTANESKPKRQLKRKKEEVE